MIGWKQRLVDMTVGIVSALAISSIAVMATSWSDLRIIKEVVAENTRSNKELQKTLSQLQIQMAMFSERYITRDELDSKLDKLRENRNGS